MIIIICCSIILLIFFGELWIKNKMLHLLAQGEQKSACFGRLTLHHYRNKGAMLNLGESRRKLIAFLSILLTIVTLVLLICSLGTKGNSILKIGLALLVGGAFSNTYDRLKRKYVVDYFSFHTKWKYLNHIIFNISDFCIIIGALLTALSI